MCNLLIVIFVSAIYAQNDTFKLIFTEHEFFKIIHGVHGGWKSWKSWENAYFLQMGWKSWKS